MVMRIIELMFPRDPSAKALPPAGTLQQARAWLRDLTGAESTQFAAGIQALQEGARTRLALAARHPSVRPHTAPPAWAPHGLIGTGGQPARSAGGPRKERDLNDDTT